MVDVFVEWSWEQSMRTPSPGLVGTQLEAVDTCFGCELMTDHCIKGPAVLGSGLFFPWKAGGGHHAWDKSVDLSIT